MPPKLWLRRIPDLWLQLGGRWPTLGQVSAETATASKESSPGVKPAGSIPSFHSPTQLSPGLLPTPRLGLVCSPESGTPPGSPDRGLRLKCITETSAARLLPHLKFRSALLRRIRQYPHSVLRLTELCTDVEPAPPRNRFYNHLPYLCGPVTPATCLVWECTILVPIFTLAPPSIWIILPLPAASRLSRF